MEKDFKVIMKQLEAAMHNVDELRRRLTEFELYLQYDAPKKGHSQPAILVTFREIFRDR